MELSKLEKILKKSVEDMTTLDKWSVFFRYAPDPDYRETVNKVIESEEVLTVAGELLMSISQNERERAIFRSRRKFQTDCDSDMVTSRDNGRKESQIAIAQNMIQGGESIGKIMLYMVSSDNEIERLQRQV